MKRKSYRDSALDRHEVIQELVSLRHARDANNKRAAELTASVDWSHRQFVKGMAAGFHLSAHWLWGRWKWAR